MSEHELRAYFLPTAGGGVQDSVTYGGTVPGITYGKGVGDIDRTIESKFGVSRWPNVWDNRNNSENFIAA